MVNELNTTEIEERLSRLKNTYKPTLQPDSAYGWTRHSYRIGLLYQKNGVLIDLGGGISLHNGVLAQLGMTVYVIDLLGEYWEVKATNPTTVHEEVRALEACGVRFIQQELSTCLLTAYFPDNSIDVVTSFHCLEHLHQSPKRLLESAMRVLKPGGKLLIEVPNAANARKRLALLLGRTNYLPYKAYYYSSDYRGHIREYVTDDLHQLASNLGAKSHRVFGSNNYGGEWIGTFPSPVRKIADVLFRRFPGLCGALLLEMTKP
jgi:SAM-dependent methyltransferase